MSGYSGANGSYLRDKVDEITDDLSDLKKAIDSLASRIDDNTSEVLDLKKSIDSLANSIDDNTSVVKNSAQQVSDSIQVMGQNAGRLLDVRLVVLILLIVFGANVAGASSEIFALMVKKWLTAL